MYSLLIHGAIHLLRTYKYITALSVNTDFGNNLHAYRCGNGYPKFKIYAHNNGNHTCLLLINKFAYY